MLAREKKRRLCSWVGDDGKCLGYILYKDEGVWRGMEEIHSYTCEYIIFLTPLVKEDFPPMCYCSYLYQESDDNSCVGLILGALLCLSGLPVWCSLNTLVSLLWQLSSCIWICSDFFTSVGK